jgi:hypothetical protein
VGFDNIVHIDGLRTSSQSRQLEQWWTYETEEGDIDGMGREKKEAEESYGRGIRV